MIFLRWPKKDTGEQLINNRHLSLRQRAFSGAIMLNLSLTPLTRLEVTHSANMEPFK